MKRRIFSIMSIIITFVVPGISFGILFVCSNITDQDTQSLPYITFEEWKDAILAHNNMKSEDIINLPQNSISSLYEQANIYQYWSYGLYSTKGKNKLLLDNINTPYIKYLGPNNLPIEGYDLKSHNDQEFELNFRLDDNIINEWIVRVYAYLDYDIYDTVLSQSNKFEDGSTEKSYLTEEEPVFQELNPDVSFMGFEFDTSLENYEEWTNSEKDYTAKKNIPGRIDQEIYFHVKVLYKKDIYEEDGWYSHYFYKNFHISGFWTPNLEYRKLNIKDDDLSPPTISDLEILNSPIYDGYESINFKMLAEDESGIESLYINLLGNNYFDDDHDLQISVPNPSFVGEYSFNIVAIDGDKDREDDQLRTTMYSSFEILDDDNNTPICSDICIVNAPIYDAYDHIIFEFTAEDPSGISELYIYFMENKYFLNGNNQILVPNPRVPGEYDFDAVAIDADLDHQGDQLNTTISSSFEVFDDDLTPPQIFLYENDCDWSVYIIDDDGFIDSLASGNYSLFDHDGELIIDGILSQEGIIYYINKDQISHLVPGIYTLEIQATNNDIEWQGDEEKSLSMMEIEITLENCYNHVIQQIEDLEKYIEKNNIYCVCICCLNYRLYAAQYNIGHAYELLLEGKSYWLSYLNSAKTHINDIEPTIEYLMINEFISHENGQYIIQEVYEISKNIDNLINLSFDYEKP